MNLENLNLVDLNAQEVETIEGGTGWWVEYIITGVIDHWTEVKNEFCTGFHTTHP